MKEYKNFEPIAKFWLSELEKYNEGPFSQKVKGTDWTMGQLYQHLYDYVTELCLPNIDKCVDTSGGQVGGKKKFAGRVLFMFGKFMSKKSKDSEAVLGFQPSQPEDIMDVRNKVIKLLKLVSEYSSKLDKLSKDQLKYKTEHPVLGFLNAEEWCKLISLHFNHHLKQKYTIDDHFRR